MDDDQDRTDQEILDDLAKLARTIPDVPLEELSLEQLAELQQATADVAKVTERMLRASGEGP